MSILVTGGSKGLGRAVALRYAEQGTDVFINFAHDAAVAERTAAQVREAGGKPHLIQADSGTIEGARAIIAAVAKATDRLDQLVHCAVDSTVNGPLLQMDPARFMRAMQCNGTALIPLVQAALPLFRAGSAVVFVTSRGAEAVVPGYAAIGVCKAAAEMLVKYLAVELAPLGVRANTVSAATLDAEALRAVLTEAEAEARLARATELNPSGRRVELSEVVDAIEFLCSERAAMVQGQRLCVDGGFYLR